MAANSLAIAFNDVQFDVINRDGQPWLQSRQLACALGYKDESSVRKIFERNRDEFTLSMTATVKMTVGITPVDIRIFSLRGCHLLAMFARTGVAKKFRVWVLDILEKLSSPSPKPLPAAFRLSLQGDPERKELTALVNAWVGCAPIHYAGARSIVNAHFGVKSIDELTVTQVKEAIAFVQGKIAEVGRGTQAALPDAPAADIEMFLARCQAARSAFDEVRMELDNSLRPYMHGKNQQSKAFMRNMRGILTKHATGICADMMLFEEIVETARYGVEPLQ